jgi:murein DD-endopeptidase MepM/ murein hydrolase activator NlpD
MKINVQHPLFKLVLNPKTCHQLNLSADNPDLKYIDSQDKLGKYILQRIRQEHALYAIGGYAENRKIYSQFEHFDSEGGKRNIHLGVDFWAPAGTPIFCPIDARVHSFQYNDNPGDYGATLILEHQHKGKAFYTLYGHISLADLEGLEKGKEFKAGDRIAHLGKENENGGWPPHLHFQVIKNLEGNSGDYPGVVASHQAKAYLSNCPNPEPFFTGA